MSLDCCIIGGGIVGLSIARELAGRGQRVRLLAREGPRGTASWAAAGIFPPAPEPVAGPAHAVAALTAFSDRLHRSWAAELRDETGIDNGLEACGGLHLAAAGVGLEELREQADAWCSRGAECRWLDLATLTRIEPMLAAAVAQGRVVGGFLLPQEARIRPPRHLEALERSCHQRGVELSPAHTVTRIDVSGGRVRGLLVRGPRGDEEVVAERYVLAAGAWSGQLAEALGLAIDTRPIRGQIALLRPPKPLISRIINRGLDYLVPREDGRILAGSTLEDVGFDLEVVPAAIDRLVGMATDLLGDLSAATVERTWAGLRPGSTDGLPSIGLTPAAGNAVIAAGHYRAGLHQSAGTAVIVADLVEGRTPPLDIRPFAPGRQPGPPAADAVAAAAARGGATG